MSDPPTYIVYKGTQEVARGTARECAAATGLHKHSISRCARNGTVSKETGLYVRRIVEAPDPIDVPDQPKKRSFKLKPKLENESTRRIYAGMVARREEMHGFSDRWEI